MRSMSKVFTLTAFVFALSAVATMPAVAVAANIAVVNKKKVMTSCSAIKDFQGKIMALEKSFKASVTKQVKDLETQASKVLAQKDTLSKEEITKKVTSLTTRQKEITKRNQDTAKKIEAALLPAMDQIKKALDVAIAKVAKAKKFDIVIDEVSAAYAAPAFDISAAVTQELNSNLKEVKISLPKIS